MKRMKLEKKNILKAVVAFAVALAFIMPGASSVTNDEMIFAGTTIYVDDDADPGWYNATHVKTIQEGIDNATAGDTIMLYAGIWIEAGVTGCTISDNVLVGNYDGVYLSEGSHNNTFERNNVSDNCQGFEIIKSNTNTFTENIANRNWKYGFRVKTSTNNTFTDNEACDNDAVKYPPATDPGYSEGTGRGFYLSSGGNDRNVFDGNIANDNLEYGFRIHGGNDLTLTDNTFDGNGEIGLLLLENDGGGMSNVLVTGNTISNSPIGILTANLVYPDYRPGMTDIGSWEINYNDIVDNTLGLVNNDTGTLNATYNYWGHASGPYHPTTNPNGLGDNVSDNVEFVPWIGYYSWDVTIDVEEQGGIIGDTAIFGEKSDAFDAQDTYDAAKQPIPPPIPYVCTWFDAGLPEPYNMLWEDYRDYPDDSEVWDLYITCNTTDTPLASVNLVASWNTTDTATAEYDHIRLYDASDVLLADMKTMGTYVFSAEFEYLYHFQIRCSMNNAPITYDDFYTTIEDGVLTVASPGILGNDEDVENTPLIALLESDVSNGMLTLNADGSFEYIPSIGFSGDDSFTYKANDGIDNSTTATVTITVLKCHHAPLQQYWNLMSLPVSEPMDKTQIVIRSGGTNYTWDEAVSGHIILDNLYNWNTTTQCYAVESSTFKPGRAYWMWAYQDCELLVYSNDVGTGDITTLQLKWDLIGFPYDTSLVKENLIVNYEGADYTWDEATTSNNPTSSPIVLKFLYGWERTSQRYAYADSFDAGEGYWMYAYKACTLTNPLV